MHLARSIYPEPFRSLTAHCVSALLCVAALTVSLAAADPVAFTATESAVDVHSHHREAGDSDVRRSEAGYKIPSVSLVRDDGKSVSLAAELDDGRPVVLNFIYTSCTTICPLSSQIFEEFQDGLGNERGSIHLVSISIDPEQDTPARLRAYAAQFHAQRGWDHYSGTTAAIIAVQKTFNVYRGDKMSHTPLTLMRSAPGQPWIRFDGFARAEDLMSARRAWALPAAALVAR